MKGGAPFHIAFGMTREEADRCILEPTERQALAIVFGELEGNRFNWQRMEFEREEP